MLIYILLYASLLYFLYLLIEKLVLYKQKKKLLSFWIYQDGKDLLEAILRLDFYDKKARSNLPQYKFYSDIVEGLLEAIKLYGAKIKGPLAELKKSLAKDIYFEKKIFSSFVGGLVQILMIVIIGLLFLFVMALQLEIQIPKLQFMFICLWQSIGLLVYFVLFLILKAKYFNYLYRLIKSLYLLRSYLDCHLSISNAIEKVGFTDLEDHKKLGYLKERMIFFIKNLKTKGTFHREDLNMLIEEIWLIFSFRFDEFEKYTAGLKMGVILSFFLTSYLYIMYSFLEMTSL